MVDTAFFPLSKEITVQQICDEFGLQFDGNGAEKISDVGLFQLAQPGGLVFFDPKFFKNGCPETQASVCFLKKEHQEKLSSFSGTRIWSDHPYVHFAKIAHQLFPNWVNPLAVQETAIHPTAKIAKTAQISPGAYIGAHVSVGEESFIGPNAVLGTGVKIGAGCTIHSNVVIQCAHIGDACSVLNGSAIGQAGFGFMMDDGIPVDMPQLGRVIIEENVSIGANTSIDRGVLDDTVIGAGTRIDNLVQIAHGVKIGRGCIIVSQVGISGSCVIGDYSALGGQVGLSDHVTLGKKVQVAAQSGVMRSFPDEEIIGGSPAVPVQQWRRQCAYLNRVTRKG